LDPLLLLHMLLLLPRSRRCRPLAAVTAPHAAAPSAVPQAVVPPPAAVQQQYSYSQV
jgi:hypothetical protein